jgi:hypothetical protein
LFHAAVLLLGTTGDVLNVLVHAIVWFQLVFTIALVAIPQSLISFPVVQSNAATFQLVAEAGQETSPAPAAHQEA